MRPTVPTIKLYVKFIDLHNLFCKTERIDMACLNFRPLHYFLAVAHDGNLTRAAAHRHVTQSAPSTQIKRLEEALGQELFTRNGRTMRTT